MRTLLAGLLGLSLVALPACASDKSDTRPAAADRAEQFRALRDDWRKAVKDFEKRLGAAQTAAEEKAALASRPDPAEYNRRLGKLIAENPKDDLACDIQIFRVLALGDDSAEVFNSLASDHIQSPNLLRLLEAFANGAPSEATGLLEKVLNDSSEKRARAFACLALGVTAYQAEKSDEAAKYFERVEKEFGSVRADKATLADVARPYLFEVRHLSVGKKAPEAVSTDLDGNKVKLSDYRGKVVVLDIWATWCGPCRAMIPHEREMVKKFAGKPFALISLSADDSRETVRDFLKEEPMPWAQWWDGPEGPVLKEWNVRFFPTIYVIDAEGIIRAKHKRGKELEEVVEKLLGATSAK